MLKKIFICILIIFLILPSCQKKEYKKYDYIFARINSVLVKIDVQTGRATPLCQDPLCDHQNKSCPFYNTGSPVPSENNSGVYYIYRISDPDLEITTDYLKYYDLTTERPKCVTRQPTPYTTSSAQITVDFFGIFYKRQNQTNRRNQYSSL